MIAGLEHVDRGRDFARRRADCWGFVMYLSQTYMGRPLPDLLDAYEGIHDTASAVDAGRRFLVEVPRAAAALGDIVLFQHHELPFHVGFCTGSGHLLQLGRRNRVTHPSFQPGTPVGRRVEGIYRHAG